MTNKKLILLALLAITLTGCKNFVTWQNRPEVGEVKPAHGRAYDGELVPLFTKGYWEE